jgi:hypothetical protein
MNNPSDDREIWSSILRWEFALLKLSAWIGAAFLMVGLMAFLIGDKLPMGPVFDIKAALGLPISGMLGVFVCASLLNLSGHLVIWVRKRTVHR